MNAQIRWLTFGACVLWAVAMGMDQVSRLGDPLGIGTNDYGRESGPCAGGSYSTRFDCKQALLLSRGNATFFEGCLRAAIVFVPPLLLWVVVGRLSRLRRPRPPRPPHIERRPRPVEPDIVHEEDERIKVAGVASIFSHDRQGPDEPPRV